MEEYLFFKNKSRKNLFGVIYYPEEKSFKGILICHPIFEEKLHVHRVLVDFSRILCSSGFNVLRFDYCGDGDSEGEFEEATVKTRLSDINSALEIFREKILLQKVALLGVRFGATLAALCVEKEMEIDALILWAPIINGNDYLHQLLRMNLTHQVVVYKKILYTRKDLITNLSQGEKVNVEGYEITRELFQQISEINLLLQDINFFGKTLLVQCSKNRTVIEPDLEKLKTLYSKNNISEMLQIPAHPFWGDMIYYPPDTAALFEKTVNWLKVNL